MDKASAPNSFRRATYRAIPSADPKTPPTFVLEFVETPLRPGLTIDASRREYVVGYQGELRRVGYVRRRRQKGQRKGATRAATAHKARVESELVTREVAALRRRKARAIAKIDRRMECVRQLIDQLEREKAAGASK